MATNLDIIKRAMRKLHVLASGTDPSSAQASDGMDALQSLLVELIGNGGLGRLADVVVPNTETAYTAFGWSRVKYSTGCTVTLPTYSGDAPDATSTGNDYGTDSGNCYAFHDMAPIVLVDNDGAATYYIFKAYSDSWAQVSGLVEQDDFPLAAHYENGFAAMLAEALADDYDTQPSAMTMRQAAWCRHQLVNKWDSESNVSPEPNPYF
jgi:hypothetical protein